MSAPRIAAIGKQDPCSFFIRWTDGKEAVYRFSELQRICPCAGCVDEETGRRKELFQPIPDDLRAEGLWSVGRYAIKVRFKSGCSAGIYPFSELRKLKGL